MGQRAECEVKEYQLSCGDAIRGAGCLGTASQSRRSAVGGVTSIEWLAAAAEHVVAFGAD